jgi:hypothetical protein
VDVAIRLDVRVKPIEELQEAVNEDEDDDLLSGEDHSDIRIKPRTKFLV